MNGELFRSADEETSWDEYLMSNLFLTEADQEFYLKNMEKAVPDGFSYSHEAVRAVDELLSNAVIGQLDLENALRNSATAINTVLSD